MSALDAVAKAILDSVDDGLGFAIVDLESGLLLGSAHASDVVSPIVLETVAAAAVDLFRGRTVAAVERTIAQARGTSASHLIKEAQLTTDRTYLFALVLPNKPSAIAVLITGRRTNLGVGWAAVRQAVPSVEPLIP